MKLHRQEHHSYKQQQYHYNHNIDNMINDNHHHHHHMPRIHTNTLPKKNMILQRMIVSCFGRHQNCRHCHRIKMIQLFYLVLIVLSCTCFVSIIINDNNNNNNTNNNQLFTISKNNNKKKSYKQTKSKNNNNNNDQTNKNRLYQTPADDYFQQYQTLPIPKIIHATIEPKQSNNNQHHHYTHSTFKNITNTTSTSSRITFTKNILIIGDVHGCFDELLQLHDKAVQEENDNVPFDHVILVGDMSNKGPNSARVIQWVRKHSMNPNTTNSTSTSTNISSTATSYHGTVATNTTTTTTTSKQEQTTTTTTTTTIWHTVRGNNDNKALLAALGSPVHRNKKIHQWIFQSPPTKAKAKTRIIMATTKDDDDSGKHHGNAKNSNYLSDDDIMWLSERPYSITIPKDYFLLDSETTTTTTSSSSTTTMLTTPIIIVHAGLLPQTNLQSQRLQDLIQLLDVTPPPPMILCQDYNNDNTTTTAITSTMKCNNNDNNNNNIDNIDNIHTIPKIPWASAWEGPEHVIFGHDASRGLQQYEYATGIDTGAVFGRKLTGIILPQRKFVSIETTRGCRQREQIQRERQRQREHQESK